MARSTYLVSLAARAAFHWLRHKQTALWAHSATICKHCFKFTTVVTMKYKKRGWGGDLEERDRALWTYTWRRFDTTNLVTLMQSSSYWMSDSWMKTFVTGTISWLKSILWGNTSSKAPTAFTVYRFRCLPVWSLHMCTRVHPFHTWSATMLMKKQTCKRVL